MADSDVTIAQLDWAVKARSANQACSLRLLKLLEEYGSIWKTKKYSRAAQDLVAVAFSLWRAAFLAHKTGKRGIVFSHGRDFLKKMIEDNAISYPVDKKSFEWTFNYYTRNARSSLQVLAQYWPEAAPSYDGRKRTPAERWEYCQELFEKAVEGFERLLEQKSAEIKEVESKVDETRAKNERRLQRNKNRKKVRSLLLAEKGS